MPRRSGRVALRGRPTAICYATVANAREPGRGLRRVPDVLRDAAEAVSSAACDARPVAVADVHGVRIALIPLPLVRIVAGNGHDAPGVDLREVRILGPLPLAPGEQRPGVQVVTHERAAKPVAAVRLPRRISRLVETLLDSYLSLTAATPGDVVVPRPVTRALEWIARVLEDDPARATRSTSSPPQSPSRRSTSAGSSRARSDARR